MRQGKLRLIVVGVVIFALVFSLGGVVAAAPPADNPGKPDKQKPVPATNVELVKKSTVKMPGPPIVPPGKDKPKKGKEEAATGTLGDSVSSSRYAVVVGISDYPGDANDLSYCDDDAFEMASALTGVYGFTNINVTLLTDMGATRDAILTAIEGIPTDAGEIVFFFSGHGMKGIADDGDKERMDEAIVAHNGTDIVPIWDGELRGCFSGFATSRIIFIFDTCLAGGMNKDLEAPGRVIAMATTERGYSYESDAWENGEFSYYFVDLGMLTALADKYDSIEGEPDVTVEEAWDYAKANCDSDKPTIGDYFENDLLL